LLKFTALDFFMDSLCRSTWKFCNENEMKFIHKSLDRFIKSKD